MQTVEKKPRKPRTKKVDMIKKKAEMAKLKESMPPKKRGRKPKGGKITKNITPIYQEVLEDKVIILHLKCKTTDIQNDTISDVTHYNPIIVDEVTPYDIHEEQNTFYILKNENDETFEKSTTKVCSENNNSSEKVKQNILLQKTIQEKLKDLEKQFNTNTVNKQSACFWCTYEFNTKPIHIPSLFFQNKYDVYGCFCSPECACSYLFNQNIDNNMKYERYQLLNYVYGKIYDYKKDIKPAPNPHYTLEKYYGNLTIQEYRQTLEYDRLILIIDKPLTKIYPELHEDTNDFETIYDNKIILKKNNKVNKSDALNKVFNT
tara:strand:- start:324 stop:1277 length:954 start_codon:yes stop_codon:yes gene_type:complete